MPHVPGLRSIYSKVGRLVHFGRMLDKIRLHATGRLPADYHANLGETKPGVFDSRCCRFLGVSYAEIRARTLAGGSDEEILAWAHSRGPSRTDEECEIWNRFILKCGWRDDRSGLLAERIRAAGGFPGRTVETFADYIEYDEGRDPVADRAWDKI